jgi:hypothetical protein
MYFARKFIARFYPGLQVSPSVREKSVLQKQQTGRKALLLILAMQRDKLLLLLFPRHAQRVTSFPMY